MMKNRIESVLPLPSIFTDKQGAGDEASPINNLRDELRQAATTIEQAIVARPGTSLAIAAATGLLVGWLLKKK